MFYFDPSPLIFIVIFSFAILSFLISTMSSYSQTRGERRAVSRRDGVSGDKRKAAAKTDAVSKNDLSKGLQIATKKAARSPFDRGYD